MPVTCLKPVQQTWNICHGTSPLRFGRSPSFSFFVKYHKQDRRIFVLTHRCFSGDFKRRDEFSNTVRTQQYREQLKGEEKQAKKQLEMIAALGNNTQQQLTQESTMAATNRANTAYLYDLVYEKDDPTRSGASKVVSCNGAPCRLLPRISDLPPPLSPRALVCLGFACH